jgi:hypothetical protein
MEEDMMIEMTNVKQLPSLFIVIILVAGVAVGVTTTLAMAEDDGSATIHACVHVKSGNIRIVEDEPCRKQERALSWNVQGTSGISGYEVVQSTSPEPIPPGVNFGWLAECPAGKVALGGGFLHTGQVVVVESHATVNNEGFYDGRFWRVEVHNPTSTNAPPFTVTATCATIRP